MTDRARREPPLPVGPDGDRVNTRNAPTIESINLPAVSITENVLDSRIIQEGQLNDVAIVSSLPSPDARIVFPDSPVDPRLDSGEGRRIERDLVEGPKIEDISPDVDKLQHSMSSGSVFDLAGTPTDFYCITENAGVWRFESVARSWIRLINSPPLAACIAIDPLDTRHVVVGTRNGTARPLELNSGGLWESTDGGDSWLYVFNPLKWLAGAQNSYASQAVYAAAFTPEGDLYFGTAYGVGAIKRASGSAVLVHATTAAVTSIAVPQKGFDLVWALTADQQLHLGQMHGVQWSANAPAIGCNQSVLGAVQSLAAFNSQVATLGHDVQGLTTVFFFDQSQMAWTDQQELRFFWSNLFPVGDGTGLGGRFTLRSFFRSGLSGNGQPGTDFFLLAGLGQDVLATAFPAVAGRFEWVDIVTTSGAGYPGSTHADIWSVYYEPDSQTLRVACDGGVYTGYWNSGEPAPILPQSGGVTPLLRTLEPMNNGLHNHHAHQVFCGSDTSGVIIAYPTTDNDTWIGQRSQTSLQEPPLGDLLGFGATQDGFRRSSFEWLTLDSRGDTSSVDGDLANRRFVYSCRNDVEANLYDALQGHQGFAFLIEPSNRVSAQSVRFVQTPRGEAIPPFWDIVMIVSLPLITVLQFDRYWNVVGSRNSTSEINGFSPGFALITSSGFATPFSVKSLLTWNNYWQVDYDHLGWDVVSASRVALPSAPMLPDNPSGIFVSNGHDSPVYYLTTTDNALWRLDTRIASPQWEQTSLRASSNVFCVDPAIEFQKQYGPVHNNPYRAEELYVATLPNAVDGSGGVLHSTDSGGSFQLDSVLTRLVNGSGMFEISGTGAALQASFRGWLNVEQGTDRRAAFATRLPRPYKMPTLGQIVFNPDNPSEAFAISPFTGVFYRDGDGAWRCLNFGSGTSLPMAGDELRPTSPIAGIAMDGTSVFVIADGGGLFEITDFRRARLAVFFVPASDSSFGVVPIASIRDGRNSSVSGKPVMVSIRSVTDVATIASFSVTSTSSGDVTLREVDLYYAGLRSGVFVATVRFAGDKDCCPALFRTLISI